MVTIWRVIAPDTVIIAVTLTVATPVILAVIAPASVPAASLAVVILGLATVVVPVPASVIIIASRITAVAAFSAALGPDDDRILAFATVDYAGRLPTTLFAATAAFAGTLVSDFAPVYYASRLPTMLHTLFAVTAIFAATLVSAFTPAAATSFFPGITALEVCRCPDLCGNPR